MRLPSLLPASSSVLPHQLDEAPRVRGGANARAPDELIYISKPEVKHDESLRGDMGKLIGGIN